LQLLISATGQTIRQSLLQEQPHCTFQVIIAHFVHHCTLKQALQAAWNVPTIRVLWNERSVSMRLP